MIRRALLLALIWGEVARAQSVTTIRLDDAGPGPGPERLAHALASRYTVIPPGTGSFVLHRDSIYRRTVIVLGRDAVIEGSVNADVIVVGGDLFLRPAGSVSGRAMAIGGGVYESSLAHVGAGIAAYRTFTYDITEIPGGFSLRYRSLVDRRLPPVTWPGLFGLRLPNYDRTDGLSLPVSPRIAFPKTPLVVEPRVTYRSQLGVIDPSIALDAAIGRTANLRADVGRSTFSNDNWIWHDLINSAATLSGGDDARNYFRATRANLIGSKRWESRTSTVEPYLGVRWESDRSTRPDSFANGGPWSFEGRHDRDDMLRANPPIDDGTISSLLVGARFEWSDQGMSTRVQLDGEWGHLSPIVLRGSDSSTTFAQTTLDGTITFPTFGSQTLRIEGHAVVTLTSTAPRQRWAYLGGTGSVPTLSLLERGGDQLVFLDGRYNFPIERWSLPLVGAPVVSLREVLGGADVNRFPALAQATGVRVIASVLYAEYLVDPVQRRGSFAVGVAIAR